MNEIQREFVKILSPFEEATDIAQKLNVDLPIGVATGLLGVASNPSTLARNPNMGFSASSGNPTSSLYIPIATPRGKC